MTFSLTFSALCCYKSNYARILIILSQCPDGGQLHQHGHPAGGGMNPKRPLAGARCQELLWPTYWHMILRGCGIGRGLNVL